MNYFERPKFIIPKENQMEKKQKYLIPENEISESFSRSSGKGGQNVNKVSTKVELRWNVNITKAFSEEEKEKIQKALSNRITKEGDLIITSQKERTQLQNRKIAKERLNELVAIALEPEEERIPTKPTFASKERQSEEKRRTSQRKQQRSKKFDELYFL